MDIHHTLNTTHDSTYTRNYTRHTTTQHTKHNKQLHNPELPKSRTCTQPPHTQPNSLTYNTSYPHIQHRNHTDIVSYQTSTYNPTPPYFNHTTPEDTQSPRIVRLGDWTLNPIYLTKKRISKVSINNSHTMYDMKRSMTPILSLVLVRVKNERTLNVQIKDPLPIPPSSLLIPHKTRTYLYTHPQKFPHRNYASHRLTHKHLPIQPSHVSP